MSILKKIFFLSLTLFFLSALLWGVYSLSFKKSGPISENVPEDQTKEESSSIFSRSGSGDIFAITEKQAASPALSLDGNFIKYYSPEEQKIFQTDLEGKNKKELSAGPIPDASSVLWSNDKTKFIALSEKNGQNTFSYYSSERDAGSPIKKNLDQVAWDSSGNKIFYKYYDQKTGERTLNVSDPDGSNWKELAKIDYRDISISAVPKTALVSFWNKPDSFSGTVMQSMPVIGGEKKTISNEKFGADYLWNKSGNKLLISHSDRKGGSETQLGIMNYNGGEYRNLDIPTFVSKCAWSRDGKTIYYALPGDLPENAVLPNDYLEGKFRTTDTFWKADTETGEKERLLEPSKIAQKMDASGLFLNQDESILFFTNKIDGRLHRIDL